MESFDRFHDTPERYKEITVIHLYTPEGRPVIAADMRLNSTVIDVTVNAF